MEPSKPAIPARPTIANPGRHQDQGRRRQRRDARCAKGDAKRQEKLRARIRKRMDSAISAQSENGKAGLDDRHFKPDPNDRPKSWRGATSISALPEDQPAAHVRPPDHQRSAAEPALDLCYSCRAGGFLPPWQKS